MNKKNRIVSLAWLSIHVLLLDSKASSQDIAISQDTTFEAGTYTYDNVRVACRVAERLFHKLLKCLRYAPRRIVPDKIRSYGATRKEVLLDMMHDNDKWQIIGPRCSINPPASGSGRCGDLNRLGRRNASFPSMTPSTICSAVRIIGWKSLTAFFRDRALALSQETTCVQNAG